MYKSEGVKGIWITWEKQRRNLGISSSLRFPLYEVLINKSRFIRYALSIYSTLKIIHCARFRVIAVQNPSIVLASVGVLSKYFLKYALIVDAHNCGIFPGEGDCKGLMLVSRWIQRSTDITIVSNCELASVVQSNGGRAFVLPDRIPDVPPVGSIPLHGRANIVFVCRYHVDEPYKEVIEAATLLPSDVVIYITGNYKGKVNSLVSPKNVKLLGFVPDNTFWAYLNSADLVMDLTRREGCLVCGAYEGIALSKPLILSNTRAMKAYFSCGCVYVMPDAKSIASGILDAIENIDNLRSGILKLKQEIEHEWNDKIIALQEQIEDFS
jgi:hypothetical protein